MKVLSINNTGTYQAIEIPDIKIYKISELVNCTIPPMFILFNHELFTLYEFQNTGNKENWGVYSTNMNGTLIYDFANHKIVRCTDSTEQMRQKFHEGTSSSSGSGSSANE